MKWIDQIRATLSERRIKSLMKASGGHDFIDIEDSKRVGLIVNAQLCSPEDLRELNKYTHTLMGKGKFVLVIELSFKKGATPMMGGYGSTGIFIEPSRLNWLAMPQANLLQEIKRHKLDILLDFDYSEHLTSRYICSIMDATTRTGVYREGYENCYELMVNAGEDRSIRSIIQEFDYFLNMIQKKPSLSLS